MLTLKQKLKLCGFAVGIIGCFSAFGLVQEQIFRGRYGNETDPVDGKEGERFRLPISFGFIQSVFYASFARALITITNEPKNEPSHLLYAIAALFFAVATLTSHLSLQWVPYPTQIIGKASKPIPVMLMGFIIAQKRYTISKVIFVLVIVFGVILFNFKEKYESKDGENPLLGSFLIGLSLLCDGLCGATEDRMRSKSKPTALNFMFYLSLWSSLYHAIVIFIKWEIPNFFEFVSRHPEIIKYFAMIVCVGALGQFFICSMLSSFGALPLSITTTLRKFISVILSVVIHQNILSIRQWIAAGIIFAALLVDGLQSKKMTAKISAETEEVIEEKVEHNEKEKIAQITDLNDVVLIS